MGSIGSLIDLGVIECSVTGCFDSVVGIFVATIPGRCSRVLCQEHSGVASELLVVSDV